jgi:glycosyltransferase involved in cell wall biosynthesis
MSQPRVSFLISTYNRCAVLLETLDRVKQCGLPREEFEILVVDNASPDGTASAVAELHPDVRLFALRENRGPCAKNVGLPHTRGKYVVFLDDDSFPRPRSTARMMHHFERDPQLGAAVFAITLPDGSRECSAYPDVFIGCGTGFRRDALVEAGGLPNDFFMQAEEYDLSLRLLDRGWRVRTFEDLHVTHLKTPGARYSERVTQLDVRNNLVLVTRYFPEEWMLPYAVDWMKRYAIIARSKGHRRAYVKGLVQGIVRSVTRSDRWPVTRDTFESFTKINAIEQRMQELRKTLDYRRVLFVDLGKNMLAYWLAAKRCGMLPVAVADPKLAQARKKYRGAAIVDDETARGLEFDVAIISNLSPVHAQRRREQWRMLTDRPVIDLFESVGSPV